MEFINTTIAVLFFTAISSCNHSQNQHTALVEKEKSENSGNKPVNSGKTVSSEKTEKAKRKTWPPSKLMQVYYDPAFSFSMYYPKTWKLFSGSSHLWLMENPDTPDSRQIHFIPWNAGTTKGLEKGIDSLETFFAKKSLTVEIEKKKDLQTRVRGILFKSTSKDDSIISRGFALVARQGNKGILAFTWGKSDNISHNPIILLIYVLQSMNIASKPRPSPIPPEKLLVEKTENQEKLWNRYWKELPSQVEHLFTLHEFEIFK
ncbi:MAG: hypothetical protein ACQES9_03260 [Myxococcota bacterium]